MTIRTVLSMGVFLAAGCGDLPVWDVGAIVPGGEWGESNVEARLTGDLPHVGEFDADSRSGWSYTYDNWMDIGVETMTPNGWVMMMVSGETTEDGYKDVIGCSGESDGYAEFDEPAVESEVTFGDVLVRGEPATSVSIWARFADGSEATADGLIYP